MEAIYFRYKWEKLKTFGNDIPRKGEIVTIRFPEEELKGKVYRVEWDYSQSNNWNPVVTIFLNDLS